MKKVLIVLGLLLLPIAYAQLDWIITDLRCGDMILDKYEMCEKGVAENRCEILEELMGIDTACYEDHCSCLPLVNKAFCGNDKREGVEMCDGTAEDLCVNLSQRMNISLQCNTKCGCDITEPIPQDYNPEIIEQLENQSQTQKEPICGNKIIEAAEECDPPQTICTTNLGKPGKCTDDCKCEVLSTVEQNLTTNVTEGANATTQPIEEVNVTENAAEDVSKEPPQERKGFFAKLWSWILALFS